MATDRRGNQPETKAELDRDTPYMTFLPLLEEGYNPGLHKATGIVAGSGAQPEKWLEDMARHMVTSEKDVGFAIPDVLASQQQMKRFLRMKDSAEGEDKRQAWRGLLAMALLWDSWEKDATWPQMTVERFDGSASSFAASVLSSLGKNRGGEPIRLLVLAREQDHALVQLPLGMVSTQVILVPAASPGALGTLLPDRVTWFDTTSGSFADPCPFLNESDRARLIAQLRLLQRMNEKPQMNSQLYDTDALLVSVLDDFIADLNATRDAGRLRLEMQEDEAVRALRIRLQAVCGFLDHPDFPGLTRSVASYTSASLRENLLVSCFTGDVPDSADGGDSPQQVTYLWHGTPFARESALLGLESTGQAKEIDALDDLERELSLLARSSVRWNKHLSARLQSWLAQVKDSQQLSPTVRTLAETWRHEAYQAAALRQDTVTLMWSWPEDSGAVRLLLRENLGEAALSGGVHPFSDMLAFVDGCVEDALGDVTLSRVCMLPGTEETPQRMMLPPLSAQMAQYIAEGQGDANRAALLPASFHFVQGEDGITASFELRGAGSVRFVRTYGQENWAAWSPENTPTVSVWPSVPFRSAAWKAYYVYAHSGDQTELCALSEGAWTPCRQMETSDGQGGRRWQLLRTRTFPAALLLRRGEVCLGALLNLLPPFLIQHAESAVIALDFGTTGTSVMLRQGGKASAMSYSCLQRTLLHGPYAAPLSDEFMPASPILPILFSAQDMFTDDPASWTEPLLDGHVYTPVSFDAICRKEAGRLYYDLKWGTEEFRGKVNRLYLRQVMMTACLTAFLNGAPDVSWRVAMPGAMAPNGRRAYWQMMNELAIVVAEDTGVPLTPGIPPVQHAPESMAASMYFRSRNEVNVRGGFITMDVGGGSAELSLWLRGMTRVASSCSLPMGAQFMLLDSLLEVPRRLKDDFADLPDERMARELSQLADQFAISRGSRRSLQKCRFMLDAFLGEHLTELSQYMNTRYGQGQCTTTQALLLLNFAFLLMLTGQMQEQAWRDPLLNDRLPGYMEVCMSGRGCLLMLGMADTLKARLKHFIRLCMSKDHPVREHLLVVSGAPKLEVATGLVRLETLSAQMPEDEVELASSVALPMSPMTVMTRFLTLFRAEFPPAAQRLFPDMFAEGGERLLSRKAELTLQTIIDNQFAQAPASSQVAYAACLEALKQSQGL